MSQSQPLISALHRLQSDEEWLDTVRTAIGWEGAGLQSADGAWQMQLGLALANFNYSPIRSDEGTVHTLPNGMSLIGVPFLSAYATEASWCLFWTYERRSSADLYRALAKATALLAKSALGQHRKAADHHAELVERAAATARIGVWGCTLPDETLSWSDGVYDLFELPRRTIVSRDEVLRLYSAESAAELEQRRARAIETLTGFSMDADITTAKGNKRILRITAAIDHINGVPTQIYGVKQDITAEHALVEQTRLLAETDPLTGIANRIRFQSCLDDLHGRTKPQAVGALLLVDLDNFKTINDTFGHLAGDACLIETARRLKAVVPPSALVARLGGDEFAIVTDASEPFDHTLPSTILEAFAAPMMFGDKSCRIGISIGVAVRQADDVADTLYHSADLALYQAKESGRGTWRLFRDS